MSDERQLSIPAPEGWAGAAAEPLGRALLAYSRRVGVYVPPPAAYVCGPSCGCGGSRPGGLGPGDERYRRALEAALASPYPLAYAVVASDPWILPHDWSRVDPAASREEYERRIRGITSAVAGDPPPHADPVLLHCHELGELPERFLSREGAWVDWPAALEALAGSATFDAVLLAGGAFAVRTASRWLRVARPPEGDARAPVAWDALRHATLAAADLARAPRAPGLRAEDAIQRALLQAAHSDFSRARVAVTGRRAHSADFAVDTRAGEVLVEVKHYAKPVPAKEVEKLVRDLAETGAAAALLVSLGGGVVGVAGPAAVRHVPVGARFKPLVVLSLPGFEGGDLSDAGAALCAMGLRTALLAADERRAPAGAAATDAIDGAALAVQLGEVNAVLGQAAASVRQATTAALELERAVGAALGGARAVVEGVAAEVRAQLCGETRAAPAEAVSDEAWRRFVAHLGRTPPASPQVRKLWAVAVRLAEPGAEWRVRDTAKQTIAQAQARGGGELTLRLLQASTTATLPVGLFQKEALFDALGREPLLGAATLAQGRLTFPVRDETLAAALPLLL